MRHFIRYLPLRFTDSMDLRGLEADEMAPRLTESFYRSLSGKGKFLMRRLKRRPAQFHPRADSSPSLFLTEQTGKPPATARGR
jgi:hypothetical protein